MEAFLHDLSWVLPLRNATLTHIFNGFTFLGYFPFFLIFLPMGYWLGDKAMFTRLTILVGVVALSNSFLKDLFQDPRPDLRFALDQRVGDSFGFPSGHAQLAVAMWLWLAVELKRAWVWLLSIFIAAGVCLSRLYLGVHDVEDVLGGALIGLATVVTFAGFLSPSFSRLQNLNPLVYLIAIAALVPALTYVWPREPVSDIVLLISCLMFFWYLGHKFQQAFIGHERHPNLLHAVIVSAVAAGILFTVFRFGGDYLTAQGMEKAHVTAAQTAFMALFATVIAPFFFRLTGLNSAGHKS